MIVSTAILGRGLLNDNGSPILTARNDIYRYFKNAYNMSHRHVTDHVIDPEGKGAQAILRSSTAECNGDIHKASKEWEIDTVEQTSKQPTSATAATPSTAIAGATLASASSVTTSSLQCACGKKGVHRLYNLLNTRNQNRISLAVCCFKNIFPWHDTAMNKITELIEASTVCPRCQQNYCHVNPNLGDFICVECANPREEHVVLKPNMTDTVKIWNSDIPFYTIEHDLYLMDEPPAWIVQWCVKVGNYRYYVPKSISRLIADNVQIYTQLSVVTPKELRHRLNPEQIEQNTQLTRDFQLTKFRMDPIVGFSRDGLHLVDDTPFRVWIGFKALPDGSHESTFDIERDPNTHKKARVFQYRPYEGERNVSVCIREFLLRKHDDRICSKCHCWTMKQMYCKFCGNFTWCVVAHRGCFACHGRYVRVPTADDMRRMSKALTYSMSRLPRKR